jgi:hypothetical protein
MLVLGASSRKPSPKAQAPPHCWPNASIQYPLVSQLYAESIGTPQTP